MASYDNKPLDGNGLSHLWAKIKALFALKTEIPAAGSTTPVMDGTGSTGTSTDYARADHVHPTDTSRAPLASPALTGTPTAPTAAAGTNTTQIATTAFVKAATDALDTGVTGVKGSSESTYRTGQVNITAANIGVEAGAQVNQNAFSNVKVGTTTIAADTKTDTLTLTAGSNVTLTPNTTSDSVTIAATDTNTTYTLTQDATDGHKITLTPSSGSATTITIPDEDTTYSDFTGATSSAAGTHGLVPAPPKTTGNVRRFLVDSGSWGTISAVDVTTSLGYNIDNVVLPLQTAQSANTVLAGPSGGSTGLPTFRALVADDIPLIEASKVNSGTFDAARIPDLPASKVTSGTFDTARIPNLSASKITSGTLGVARGGTGVSTLGAGVVYHSASGTGALSIATAANLVSAIGNSAVNRATADASGNNIASTYLTTSAASTTYLTQTSAASTYATKSEIVGLYKYKGSVATESDLPASPSTGDVYNIEAASTYGAAGANVAWNGTSWDSLGEIFQLDPLTNAEIDAICV